MITIKNKLAIAKMEEAGRLLSAIFDRMLAVVYSGQNSSEVDRWISQELAQCWFGFENEGL